MTPAQNRAFRQRKFAEYERQYARVFELGGADYDYSEANAGTVVRHRGPHTRGGAGRGPMIAPKQSEKMPNKWPRGMSTVR